MDYVSLLKDIPIPHAIQNLLIWLIGNYLYNSRR